MRKRVIVSNSNFFRVGDGISTIVYQEGKPFPSDWRWLSKILTDWTTKSESIMLGIPTNKSIKKIYGDVEIDNMYRDKNDNLK